MRIGNLYDHSGRVKKVTPIVIEALFESERIWCKAIPLTEEWLLKFGFEKIIDNEFTLRYELKKDPRFDYFFPKHNLKTFVQQFFLD